MQRTNNETEQVTEAPELTRPPDFNRPLKPIGEVVAQPGFPEAVLGEHVDIGGYTGVVVAVVKQSIKVRSPEGVVRSFKSYTLQRLYGPRPEPVPSMEGAAELGDLEGDVPKAAPPREIIEEPNFEQPITAISELLTNPDFPKSAFGQHVEIGGYTGIIVEIVNQSIRVRSRQGTSRNYNIGLLRNIYGSGRGSAAPIA